MTWLLFFILVSNAEAQDKCYWLERPGPEFDRQERWCYSPGSDGSTLIYNADDLEYRPELAVRVLKNGWFQYNHEGRVITSTFNPLSIPVDPPEDAEWVSEPAPELRDSAEHAEREFLNAPEILATGPLSGKASKKPWVGSHWGYPGGKMFKGSEAPLAKYERFVSSRTGNSLQLVEWERRHHAGSYWWGGHCNGWAVASILRPEPRVPRFDSRTGMVFKVSHQKGLVVAKDFCAKISMYGRRNNNSAADRSDISPADFHQAITYHVGTLKKLMAVDYRADAVVETHVISAYSMKTKTNASGVMRVEAAVTMHRYDNSPSEKRGVAPSYTRRYVYDLNLNQDGEVTGGKWISANPDFMYVALAHDYCSNRHPGLTEDWLSQILSLPPVD